MAAKKPTKTKSVGSSKATSKPVKKTPVKKTQKDEKKIKDSVRNTTDETLEYVREQKDSTSVVTHAGVKITWKEAKFIDEYIAHGNKRQAVINAGFKCKAPNGMASQLLKKSAIADEISWRMTQHHEYQIATREEIMEFFTQMMKGEILDQFDMPTTNSDKIKAGIELAKRTIDIEDRIKERNTQTAAPEIKISLNWEKKENDEED